MFFQGTSDAGFSKYLASIQRFPLLDREAEAKLAWRVKAGDQAAADQLICANLRWVVRIASKYQGYGFRLADLVGEGNLGLLEAIKRFEPERNLRFMTYAGYWVRAMVLGHVLRQWKMVGVGTGPLQSKMFFRLARERSKLETRLGDRATVVKRLARKFGTSVDRVLEMEQRLAARDVSLDQPLYDGTDASRMDLLQDGSDTQEEAYSAAEQRTDNERRVWWAMEALDTREKMIVSRRLLAEDPATLAELGQELSISRERVRQLEVRARSKLKRALETEQQPHAA